MQPVAPLPRLLAPRRFADDRRGAIVLMGVFMAAFLVGTLWYVIGIGDAAIYRAKMQDGADAVAFASAVYHARGMNIIAMLNLIMAAVLAVLVALKIGELLINFTATVACLLAPINPVAATLCTFIKGTAKPLIESTIKTVEPIVDKVLRVLSKTQVAVARGTPFVAEAKAVLTSQAYGPQVKLGGMLSASLIANDPRLGLPVSEDRFDKLCERSGRMVGKIALWPLEAVNVPVKWANPIVGRIVKFFPQVFCGGKDVGQLKNAIDKDVKIVCEGEKEDFLEQEAEKPEEDRADWTSAMQTDCEKKNEDAAKAKNLKKYKLPNGTYDAKGKTPKVVFGPAQNGDDYFQVWSAVWGEPDAEATADRDRVRSLPAWNLRDDAESGNAILEALTKVAVAESEFYFDEKGKWSDYQDDAMWKLQWRARMRRVHVPVPEVFEVFDNWAGGKATAKIRDMIDRDSGFIGTFIGRVKAPLTAKAKDIDTSVSNAVNGEFRDWVVH